MERYFFRRQRRLFKRPCSQCKKEIKTCYSAERPEIVYCETCYNKMVY